MQIVMLYNTINYLIHYMYIDLTIGNPKRAVTYTYRYILVTRTHIYIYMSEIISLHTKTANQDNF